MVNAVMQGLRAGPEGGDGCTFYAEGCALDRLCNRAEANPAGAGGDGPLCRRARPLVVSGDMIFFGDITVEAAIASL